MALKRLDLIAFHCRIDGGINGSLPLAAGP